METLESQILNFSISPRLKGLMNCMQKEISFPKMEGTYFFINLCHKFLGYTGPCAPFVVFSISEATKRLSVNKTRKSITVDHLELLYRKLATKSKSLSNFRLMTTFILGFCGFIMCYSEVSNLLRST